MLGFIALVWFVGAAIRAAIYLIHWDSPDLAYCVFWPIEFTRWVGRALYKVLRDG